MLIPFFSCVAWEIQRSHAESLFHYMQRGKEANKPSLLSGKKQIRPSSQVQELERVFVADHFQLTFLALLWRFHHIFLNIDEEHCEHHSNRWLCWRMHSLLVSAGHAQVLTVWPSTNHRFSEYREFLLNTCEALSAVWRGMEQTQADTHSDD